LALPEVELAPELLGPEGPFVEVLEGFEWRSGQQEMAAAVARALQEDVVRLALTVIIYIFGPSIGAVP
jgi:hypothetical protein